MATLKKFFRHLPQDTKYISIAELVLNPLHIRKHPQKQIKKLIKSYHNFGFNNPCVINTKNELISGYGRVLALKEMKISEVPVVYLENMTQEEIKAYMIAENRISNDAEWDYGLLKENLESLFTFNYSFEDFAFDTVEYEQIFIKKPENAPLPTSDDEASWIEQNIPQRVTFGDLYKLGGHLLLCGDALKRTSYEFLMKDDLAHIVLTDPPYNSSINKRVCGLGKIKHKEFEMASGEMSQDEFAKFLSDAMKNLVEFSLSGSLHYIWMDWCNIKTLLIEGEKLYQELKNICIWVKETGGMGSQYRSRHEMIALFKNGRAKHQNNIQLGKNGRYRTNVWEYPAVRACNPESLELLRFHPTTKCVAMFWDCMLDSSSPNDIVLDCFGGSGTTLIAAERAGRRARLIEISPRYCDVIIYRWEKETGKKAELVCNMGDK